VNDRVPEYQLIVEIPGDRVAIDLDDLDKDPVRLTRADIDDILRQVGLDPSTVGDVILQRNRRC
jgi:hypothetical protein